MPLYALDGKAPRGALLWLAPDAQVMGDVSFGAEVGVWFGAVIRADNEPMQIGARTNVQDGCVLHSDRGRPLTIGEGCTIGHRAVVHGCTLGDDVLVGMGAVILNGARIGAGSLIGAGAVVKEDTEIPPRSLVVGAPARVARTLDDGAVEKLRASALGYVANARRFAAGLRPAIALS